MAIDPSDDEQKASVCATNYPPTLRAEGSLYGDFSCDDLRNNNTNCIKLDMDSETPKELPNSESMLCALLRQFSDTNAADGSARNSAELFDSHSRNGDSGESHVSSLESLSGYCDKADCDTRTTPANADIDENNLLHSDVESLGSSTSCSSDFETNAINETKPGLGSNMSNGAGRCSDLQQRETNLKLLEDAEKFLETATAFCRTDSCTSNSSSSEVDTAKKASTCVGSNGSSTECLHKQRLNPFLSSIPVPNSENFDADNDDLDTGMPEFDFENLERQLNSARRERALVTERVVGNGNEKNLAGNGSSNFYMAQPPVPVVMRPCKSNLAARLQSGKNLQLCFMNDVNIEDSDEVHPLPSVPKSKSAPHFDFDNDTLAEDMDDEISEQQPTSYSLTVAKAKTTISKLARSISNVGDSMKRASELRRMVSAQLDDPKVKKAVFENEAKLMLVKAKMTAQMQMEVEKQVLDAARKSQIEHIVPVSKKKLSRLQLTKMNLTELQLIANDMHGRIEVLNEQLVKFLIERDNLHMEQDSLLVDVEDLLQYAPKMRRCPAEAARFSDCEAPAKQIAQHL